MVASPINIHTKHVRRTVCRELYIKTLHNVYITQFLSLRKIKDDFIATPTEHDLTYGMHKPTKDGFVASIIFTGVDYNILHTTVLSCYSVSSFIPSVTNTHCILITAREYTFLLVFGLK